MTNSMLGMTIAVGMINVILSLPTVNVFELKNNPKKMNQPESSKQVQIKATDDKLKGEYSNAMQVLHTKEEFVVDFLSVFPPSGMLNARIIVSPGHFKRMAKAIQDNLKRYEEKFGKIEESDMPENKGFGFQG
jgi:3-deoxy-D-manno-octulosonic-acid transferase